MMKALGKLVLVVVLSVQWLNPSYGAHPTGCSYDSDYSKTGIYTCAFGSYTEPLSYGAFSNPYPQRLKITGLSGSFPAAGTAFSGFSGFSSANFDSNYPASLELVCSSSITLASSTFTGMSYLQEVKFSHCSITSLSNGMLGSFGNLNSLIFEYGGVGSYSTDFLTGVSIQTQSVPEPKGELVFKDFTLTPTSIPAGVFDAQTSAKSIRIENCGVTAIASTVFGQTTKLTQISITDNPLTTLDNDLFTGLNSLYSVDFNGIQYDCTCSTLGVLTFASDNSITLPSNLICNTPASFQNKRATSYYADTCATKEEGCSGMSCITTFEIVGFVFLIIALVVSCIALGIICHSRRQLMTAKSSMEKKRNSSWTKVQNAMRAVGGRGRQAKPPMRRGGHVNKGSDGWM